MNVYTDAFFSPEGEESHGCVVVMMNEIAWKSSRQTVISLSTAESELLEIIEGFTLGESTSVVFEEVMGDFSKVLWSDSQSALAALSGEGGSWRTRHLRMRAMYARQLVSQGSWGVHHCPGEEMVANMGTKPLASVRLEFLKNKAGMDEVKIEEERLREDEEEEKFEEGEKEKIGGAEGLRVKEALRLVVLMASMSCGSAQGGEEVEGEFWKKLMAVLAIVIVFAVIIFFIFFVYLCRNPANKEDEENTVFIFFIYFWRLPANKEDEENKDFLYFLDFLQPFKRKIKKIKKVQTLFFLFSSFSLLAGSLQK